MISSVEALQIYEPELKKIAVAISFDYHLNYKDVYSTFVEKMLLKNDQYIDKKHCINSAWMKIKFVAREMIDFRGKPIYVPLSDDLIEQLIDPEPVEYPDYDIVGFEQEIVALIKAELTKQNDNLGVLIIDRFLQLGYLPAKEISNEIGIDVKTIRNRFRSAKKRVKTKLYSHFTSMMNQ